MVLRDCILEAILIEIDVSQSCIRPGVSRIEAGRLTVLLLCFFIAWSRRSACRIRAGNDTVLLLTTAGVMRCPFRRPPPTGGSSEVRKINKAPPMRSRFTVPPPSCDRAPEGPMIKEATIAAKYMRLSGEDMIKLLASSNGESTGDIILEWPLAWCRVKGIGWQVKGVRQVAGRIGERQSAIAIGNRQSLPFP